MTLEDFKDNCRLCLKKIIENGNSIFDRFDIDRFDIRSEGNSNDICEQRISDIVLLFTSILIVNKPSKMFYFFLSYSHFHFRSKKTINYRTKFAQNV